jgi:hypothetical protein
MTDFSEMAPAARQELVTKVADCLKEHGLGDVPVSTAVENVGILMAGQLQKSTSLKVEKALRADQDDLATKFNEAVKKVTDGVANVTVDVVAKISAGDQY